MNIVTPNTSSVSFKIKTRPTQSFSPFRVRMDWENEESYVTGSVFVTASYDSEDFLVVTASLYASGSNYYNFRLFQMSGSTACNELYRGELYPTTQSPIIIDSEPFFSYTSASGDFIIF